MTQTAAEIWRKYEISGVPASGPHKPVKADTIVWGTLMEDLRSGAGLAYATRALLLADLAHAANVVAMVYNDTTAAYNGVYQKSGASGAGTWTRITDSPSGIVRLTVTGGTGNAIVATATETPTVPGNKIYLLTPTAANTGATTIAVNGGSAVAIKNALGSALAASSLLVDLPVMMLWQTDHYQIAVSVPVDATGILSDAIAARDDAEVFSVAAASSASALGNQVHQYDTRALAIAATIPVGVQAIKVTRYAAGRPLDYATYIPGTSAGPMAFQEAGGHWWKLDISGMAVAASWFGVAGDGVTDDGPALQVIIDSLDVNFGGTVLLEGDIRVNTPISLKGRTGITFEGVNAGAANGGYTMIRTSLGVVPRLIDMRGAKTCGWKRIWFQTIGTDVFSGLFMDWGRNPDVVSDNNYCFLEDCRMHGGSVNNIMLMLQGSTNGMFRFCAFTGSGYLVYGARPGSTPLAFSGVHNFISCNFGPTGNGDIYPVFSPGGGWVFTNCNWQASSGDGKGRAILGANSTETDAEGLTLLGCTFFDVTAPGGQWIYVQRGAGINITGCFIGGHAGQAFIFLGGGVATGDPNTSGLRGAVIMGNVVSTMLDFITFGGSSANGTNARNIIVGGNSLTNVTNPYNSLGSAENVINLSNFHYGNPSSIAATLSFSGIPGFANRTAAVAAGYTTGQLYFCTTAGPADNFALCRV